LNSLTSSLPTTTTSTLHESSMLSIIINEDNTIKCCVAEGSEVQVCIYQDLTYPLEVIREWPEVVVISEKLLSGVELGDREKIWIEELARATGWRISDIINELKNIDVDPSERSEGYRELFKEYYEEAQQHKTRGDTRQAAEKLWGAVTALVKLYASLKGMPVTHWSLSRLDKFVENNVEEEYKKLFRDLLDKAHILHEHFYEGYLSSEGFEARWREVIELIERAREVVLKQSKI